MSGKKDIMLGSFFFLLSSPSVLEVSWGAFFVLPQRHIGLLVHHPSLPPPLPASLDSAQLEHNLEVVCIPWDNELTDRPNIEDFHITSPSRESIIYRICGSSWLIWLIDWLRVICSSLLSFLLGKTVRWVCLPSMRQLRPLVTCLGGLHGGRVDFFLPFFLSFPILLGCLGMGRIV